jgi:long-subunit fatty acid transport protein
MKKLIFTIIVLVTYHSFAQNHFGIQAGFGVSRMANSFYPDNETQHTTEFIKPAMLIGLYYENQLNDKLDLGVGLNYNQSNSYEEWRINNETQQVSVNIKKKISSIGIPVYLKWNFEKFSINPGVRTSIIVKGGTENYKDWDGDISSYSSDLNIDKLAFGAQLGLNYEITEKLKLETLFYKDISNTYKESNFVLKTWQLLFGIKYDIK